MKKLLFFATGVALVFTAQNSLAGSLSGNLNYSVTLQEACTAISTSSLATFGTFDTAGADLANVAAGSVSVTCPAATVYRIMLDAGAQPTGASATDQRQLIGTTSSQLLQYDLLNGSGGPLVGDNNSLDVNYIQSIDLPGIDGNILGGIQTYPVFANVKIVGAAVPPVADTYTDSVVATVTW
ncbi:MAG: hypothetical protein D3915_15695 [Candidatus Electrothrix sp. AU1_5]|nr:hypothetical protein [Candidatus Electrothrix gigas]